MNKILDYFIRTMRLLQSCNNIVRPFSKTELGTVFGINGYKSSVQCIKPLLYVSSCWLHSSVWSCSQDTLMYDRSISENKQKNMNTLLDEHEERLEPTQVNSIEEGRNTIEEKDERSVSQQFFSDLQKCSSPCDVLELAARSPISQKYASTCLSAMWTLKKKISEDQKYHQTQLILEHPQFKLLCQCVMHEAKYMFCTDLVHTLLATVKLGVPQNTRLVQTLLRICQERLNEFDVQCISIMAKTLKEMEKCKNVKALQNGLQLFVEEKLPKISSVFILQTIMSSIEKDAPLTLKKKLENKILSLMDYFTVQNASQMFTVLGEMNYFSIPVLNACSQKIIENTEGIPLWKLLSILRTCREFRYHNNALHSALADYAASIFPLWNTKQVVLLLSAFAELGFRPVELMDKFVEKMVLHPESLDLRAVVAVLRAYSRLNHIPSHQNQEFFDILNCLLNKYLHQISGVVLLRAVYSFCLCGYLPQLALNQLLQEEILNDLVTSEHNKMMLSAINVCLELDGDSSGKPAILSEKLLSPIEKVSAVNFPDVQEVLRTVLGNENLFRSNVHLTQGYHLDFEILMDTNRKIAVANTERDQLRDDSNLKRIAVLCPPASAFCVVSNHPQGRLAMKMRHLNHLGYHIILVLYKEFQNLKKDEAVEFFKREMFLAEKHSASEKNIQDDCTI